MSPFRSKAQMAYLYANHPDIAKRWSKEFRNQNIKKLPKHGVPRTYKERRCSTEFRVWSCAEDERRSLEIGWQEQVANHLKLL